MALLQSRREFTASLSLAGTAALIGSAPALADEGPPETTTVRLPRWVDGAYCWAALYIAGELLRAEGFTDVRYVEADSKRRPVGVDRTRRDGFLCELCPEARRRRSRPACRSRCSPACIPGASN